MKIFGLSLLLMASLLGTFTNARVHKMTRRSRKLDEDNPDTEINENPQVENENPDLEMLEDLENEVGTDGNNIFQELMEQKMNMIERLELLESMVNEELLQEENEKDKGKHNHKALEPVEEKSSNEPEENWIIVHRQRLINLFVLGIIFAFLLLIGWKLSKLSADLVQKKKAVKLFQQKLEQVDEKEIDSLVASWKDQREGISKIEETNPRIHGQPDPQFREARAGVISVELAAQRHQQVGGRH